MALAQVWRTASALEAASQAVLRSQEPLRLARRTLATAEAALARAVGPEPDIDASHDEWRDYCEALDAAPEARETERARVALDGAEEVMLDAVEAFARVAGAWEPEMARRGRARVLLHLRNGMLDAGMRLR